jgi:hypothetical protein
MQTRNLKRSGHFLGLHFSVSYKNIFITLKSSFCIFQAIPHLHLLNIFPSFLLQSILSSFLSICCIFAVCFLFIILCVCLFVVPSFPHQSSFFLSPTFLSIYYPFGLFPLLRSDNNNGHPFTIQMKSNKLTTILIKIISNLL